MVLLCQRTGTGKGTHLGHAADVLLPVLGGEAEVLVQPRPDEAGYSIIMSGNGIIT